MIGQKETGIYRVCVSCNSKTYSKLFYKRKPYCNKCYDKCIVYESDSLRKKYDIRNKDFDTLTWYQQAHRRRQEEELELHKNDDYSYLWK